MHTFVEVTKGISDKDEFIIVAMIDYVQSMQRRRSIPPTYCPSSSLRYQSKFQQKNIYNKQKEDEESGRVLLDIIVDRKGFNLEKN